VGKLEIIVIPNDAHDTSLSGNSHFLAGEPALTVGEETVSAGAFAQLRPALTTIPLVALGFVGRSQGAPRAAHAALAIGLSVVTSHIGVIADAVADGVTGYLGPPQGHNFTNAGQRFVSDPAAGKRTHARGWKPTVERFSVEGFARIHAQRRRVAPVRPRSLATSTRTV
jgi:hypothetical protein